MMNFRLNHPTFYLIIFLLLMVLSACFPTPIAALEEPETEAYLLVEETAAPSPLPDVTLPPERPQYAAGE